VAQKPAEPEQDPHPESSGQREPFVPPKSPDSVPKADEHPAKPEAIDSDFTPAPENPSEETP
jgi:hypothetical protein